MGNIISYIERNLRTVLLSLGMVTIILAVGLIGYNVVTDTLLDKNTKKVEFTTELYEKIPNDVYDNLREEGVPYLEGYDYHDIELLGDYSITSANGVITVRGIYRYVYGDTETGKSKKYIPVMYDLEYDSAYTLLSITGDI